MRWRGGGRWCPRHRTAARIEGEGMGPAFLPDFELIVADGTQRLVPRIGAIVQGELCETSTTGRESADGGDLFSCTVILVGGSCVAATASAVQGRLPAPLVAQPGPSRVFRAAGVAAQPSTVPGLFVYGTLMRGEDLGHVLSGPGLADVQPATVQGQLRNLGDCPGLLLSEPDGIVLGEFAILADPGAVLPELDEIECARAQGEPGGLYRRSLVMAMLGDGREVTAWVYVIDDPGTHPIIRSGSWRDRSL